MSEGQVMGKPAGSEVMLPADQMEVSSDGKYYYFQTMADPMYRVETPYLDNFNGPSVEIARRVRYFFNSLTCGGTTIDADANQKRVLQVTPSGQSSTPVQSPDLI